MEILSPRDVPLGGLRAMTVRRTLPQRQRTLHRRLVLPGPLRPRRGRPRRRHGRAAAPAHRPADGELAVHRRDRAPRLRRSPRAVRPGELNLMTAGRGISHCEYSTPDTTTCTAPSCGWRCRTATGRPTRTSSTTRPTRSPATAGRPGCSSARCSDRASPVRTYSPLLGAELTLEAGTTLGCPSTRRTSYMLLTCPIAI